MQWKLKIPAPILSQHNLANVHFEHIAGTGISDRNRAGEQMGSRSTPPRAQHLAMVRQHRKAARRLGQVRRLAGQGIDRNPIARTDGEDRRERAIPVAPMYRLWQARAGAP